MARHRLATEADYYRLPAPRPANVTAGGFQLLPASLLADSSPENMKAIAELYRQAFEMACAAARPSRPEDVLFSQWN